jgi:hypothetical protein
LSFLIPFKNNSSITTIIINHLTIANLKISIFMLSQSGTKPPPRQNIGIDVVEFYQKIIRVGKSQITVVVVAASAPLSLTAARKPGRAAEVASITGKETKYKAACDANAWTQYITYYQFVLSLLPDLMLYNAPDFNKPVVADVCITCPIPVAASAPLSLITNARKPGCAAQLARSGKETKYKAACDANGLELLPICIESTGAHWGKTCDDFFKKVLKANSKGNESV